MKTKVGLVQINNSFSGQNYLPYSVGILQAYAHKFLSNKDQYEFLLPLYLREPIDIALPKLDGADVVFFSTYVWNFRISLELARTLKEKNPEVKIVFGGPHVPDLVDGFLQKFPFIDVVVHGEGEQAFTQLLNAGLDRIREKDLQAVPSVSFLDKKGQLHTTPKAARMVELEQVPSPYLSGIFEPLMKANPQEKWIVLWETNRGCPFQCTFCDWGSATQARVYKFGLDRLFGEVDWFAKHNIEFIFCADANFGMFERDYDIAKYVADSKKNNGYPHALSVQNTKNATDRAYKVQKLLADSGLNKGVTISLQSVDPDTLKKIKRANISTRHFQELQRRFTRDKVETYSDIILSMPGETYQSFIKGVATVIGNGQHNRIQFNNLSILPNAEMGNPDYQKEHGMIIIESEVVNIHGSLERSNNEILETQQLVVGTRTCPKDDWRRMRSFGWAAGLLYFNKILQIPLAILTSHFQVPIDDMISLFIDKDLKDYPTLNSVKKFFLEKAKDIQEGGAEYCSSEKWLNIWWPADELVFINLATENKLDVFYEESEKLLSAYLKENFLEVPAEILKEAMKLNRSLIKLPFQKSDLTLDFRYNIWEAYRGVLIRENIPIEEKNPRYFINRTDKVWNSWDSWCREVVWWGNKKGAYLYTNTTVEPQMSGHF